jgi:hypothetical protein
MIETKRGGWSVAVLLGGWLTVCGASAWGATPFDELLKQVPAEANVLVLIDGESLRRSPFAKDNGLAGDENATGDASVVPPREVRQAVLAAKIRGFRESLLDWQTALVSLEYDPSAAGLAAEFRGSLDQVASTDCVVLPNGAMALSTVPKMLTVLQPADRHRAGRAVAQAKSSRSPALDPFLAKAVAATGPKTDVLIALDLKDMFSKSKIFLYLKDSKTFKDRPVDINEAAKLVAAIDGMTLRLDFAKSIRGELTVHFGGPADGVSEWSKALLLEILDDTGATIEDLAGWEFGVGKQDFRLTGDLSLTGLRRVLSLLDFPTRIPKEVGPSANLSPEQLKQRTAKATLQRFRATQALYGDLRNPSKTRDLSTAEYGLWYDKYAKKIESLPSLDVDKDMLAYCDDLVLRLRVLATKSRMVGIRAGANSRSPNYVTNYFSTWYGTYYQNRQVESDYDYVQRVERASAAADKFAIYEEIDKDALAVRRAMTDRYGVEF